MALAYKLGNELEKAEPVYKRYLKANPDDKSALYGLGTLYINTKRESEGLGLLEKAWSLGHVNSLWLLAGVNVRNGHLDKVRELVPDLLRHRREDPEIVDVLVVYALKVKPPDGDLFMKAIKGVKNTQILSRDLPIFDQYMQGLRKFGGADGTERANQLEPIMDSRQDEEITAVTSNVESRKRVISSFEELPDAWAPVELLKVAIAYAAEGQTEKAIPLFERYLEVRPNRARAMRGLGQLYIDTKDYKRALELLEKAWSLGDLPTIVPLGYEYLRRGNLGKLKSLIPTLLENKERQLEVVNLIAAYSLSVKPAEKDLFMKAIDGVSDKDILSREDTTQVIIQGLEVFGEGTRAKELKAKAEKKS